jgi:hypothetical protein
MADRITNQEINVRVAYIARKLHRPTSGIGSIYVDRYSPGYNPYQYKLAEIIDSYGAVHEWTSYRMTRKEFYAYLNGLCAGIDAAQEATQ